jgi:prepilin-type N-terminal cleavage/methylation domain-containing protein
LAASEDRYSKEANGDDVMKIRRSGRTRWGFTLLELLVAVVLVAILASLAIPRFLEARNRSRVGAAQADLFTLRKALAMYAVDHDSYPAAAASYPDLETVLVDPDGKPYVTLPTGDTFIWVSYDLPEVEAYLVTVQALDDRATILLAGPTGVWIGP